MKNTLFQSKALICQVSNYESVRLCHLESGPAGYKSVSMFPEVKGEPTKEELKDKDKSLENPETPDGRNAIRAQSILYLRKYQLDAEAREALDMLDYLIQKSVRAEVRTPEPNTNPPEVADKIVAATELKAQLEGIRTIYVKSANNKKTLKQEPLTIPEDPEFPEGRNKIRSDAQEVLLKTKETAENKDNLEQIRFLLKLSYYAETGEIYRTLDKADKAYDSTVGEKTAKDAAYDKVFSEAFGKGTLPTLSNEREYKKENKGWVDIEINKALSENIAPYKEAPATAKPNAPAPKDAPAATPPATPAEDSLEKGVERDNFRSKVQRWLNKYKYETETAELRDLLRESMKAENNVPDDYHEGLILPYDRSNDRIPVTQKLKVKFDAAVAAHTADGKETAPTAPTLENPNDINDAEGRNLIRQKAIDWLAKNPNHTEAANVRLLLHNSQRAEHRMQAVTYDANNNEILLTNTGRDGNGNVSTLPVFTSHENTTALQTKLVELSAGGPATAEQPAPAKPAKVEATPPPKKEVTTPPPEPVKPAVPEVLPAPTATAVVPATPEPPAPALTAAATAPATPETPPHSSSKFTRQLGKP